MKKVCKELKLTGVAAWAQTIILRARIVLARAVVRLCAAMALQDADTVALVVACFGRTRGHGSRVVGIFSCRAG